MEVLALFGSKELKMPRYYFNLSDGGFIPDNKGMPCTTRRDVEAPARAIATEYGRNRDHISQNLSVVVTDEMGSEVLRTPVVNYARKVKADKIVDTLRSGEGTHEDTE
jgi:hypothetical protein